MGHKLEMGEWRSLVSHYTLTTVYRQINSKCTYAAASRDCDLNSVATGLADIFEVERSVTG